MADVIRLVIDVYADKNDVFATKESVAMALEHLGRARVVQIIIDGKKEKQ